MVNPSLPVIKWEKRAYEDFTAACNYIRSESPVNAENVRVNILKIVRELQENPLKYPPDKFRKNNSVAHRAFEKFSYRVAYKGSSNEIVVLRFRHVKQEPFEY